MNASQLNKGEFLTLHEIFDKKRFHVPDYQRGYSWEDPQREDLIKDIMSISKSNHMHFMGTVVAARQEYDEVLYEIVDGQQRLISLFILLHEIFESCKHSIPEDSLDWFQKLANKSDSKRLLKLNKETDGFFFKVILDNYKEYESQIKSHKNILSAKEQFGEWIKEEKENLGTYIETILHKLGFLFYSTDSTKEIGIMFEVINNRGKRLSQLEKIKNYLIYYSIKTDYEELNQRVNQYWPILLANLSKANKTTNEEENAFLRYCWLFFHSPSKAESYDVYTTLKTEYPVDERQEEGRKQLSMFVRTLVECSKYYKDLFTNTGDPFLERIRFQPVHASIMPLYLSICHVLDGEENREDRENFLELLEKLNFRIYVCPNVTKRSDTHQVTLFRYAHQFYHREKSKADLLAELSDLVLETCKIQEFVESLTLNTDENYDYQDWNGLVYFLGNYEISLNKKKSLNLSEIMGQTPENPKPDDRLTKEHIWGRKNRNKKNNRPEDYHEKARLGNIALLEGGINSQGDKKGIEEKLEIYRRRRSDSDRVTKFEMIHELPQIYGEAERNADNNWSKRYKNWYFELYRKINDIREEKMINFAIARWGLKTEFEKRVKIHSEASNERNEIFTIV